MEMKQLYETHGLSILRKALYFEHSNYKYLDIA